MKGLFSLQPQLYLMLISRLYHQTHSVRMDVLYVQGVLVCTQGLAMSLCPCMYTEKTEVNQEEMIAWQWKLMSGVVVPLECAQPILMEARSPFCSLDLSAGFWGLTQKNIPWADLKDRHYLQNKSWCRALLFLKYWNSQGKNSMFESLMIEETMMELLFFIMLWGVQ